jgi:hypothetical protein
MVHIASILLASFTLLLTTCPMSKAIAQVSLKFDINDFKSHEHEAAYTIGAGTKVVTWTTSELPMPSVEKRSDTCARIPEYMDGAICYRICGGGLASEPVGWTFQWRQANLGHQTPFQPCTEQSGCRAVNPEWYQSPQRGCAHFMIWKPYQRTRDLRVIVNLK